MLSFILNCWKVAIEMLSQESRPPASKLNGMLGELRELGYSGGSLAGAIHPPSARSGRRRSSSAQGGASDDPVVRRYEGYRMALIPRRPQWWK